MALTVRIESSAVVAKLRAMDAAVRVALLRAVTEAAIRVQARVRAKLTGEVLKEQTHHLHDSIHYEVTNDANGVIGKVGTDVVYAAAHEYGFVGVEQVRQHMRRTSVVFGKPITPIDVMVRAHARKVNLPERSFLRSTLAEMAAYIVELLEQAVGQVTAAAL